MPNNLDFCRYNNDVVVELPPRQSGYEHVGTMMGVCAGEHLLPDGRERLVKGKLGTEVECANLKINIGNHYPSMLWDGLLRGLRRDVVESPYGGCVLRAVSQCPGSKVSGKFLLRCELTTKGTSLTCGGDATCRSYWQDNSDAVAGPRCYRHFVKPWVCRAN